MTKERYFDPLYSNSHRAKLVSKTYADKKFSLRQYNEAIKSYNKFIATFKGDNSVSRDSWVDLYIKLSKCYSACSDFKEAIWSIDEAIIFSPRNSNLYLNKAWYLINKHQCNSAIKYCEKAKNYFDEVDNPNYAFMYYYFKALCFSKLNKHEEALENFDDAITTFPQYYIAYYGKAKLLLSLDQPEQAYEFLSDAIINHNIKDSLVYCLLSKCLWQQKKWEKAIASTDRAILFDINSYEAWKLKGIYLTKQEKYEQAIPNLNKAIQLEPNDFKTYKYKAISLYNLGEYSQILDFANKLLNPEQDFNFGYKCVIDCYRKLGEEDKATKLQEKYDQIVKCINSKLKERGDESDYNHDSILYNLKEEIAPLPLDYESKQKYESKSAPLDSEDRSERGSSISAEAFSDSEALSAYNTARIENLGITEGIEGSGEFPEE